MTARNYKDRLHVTRAIWSCVVFIVWAGYVAEMGFQEGFWSVTIVLAVVWWLGWPPDMAKRLARRAERINDLNEAIEDELVR